MTFDPAIHHRRAIRLAGHDYASSGAYFVTICVQGRECLFGDVVDGVMVLSEAGRMIEEVWSGLPNRYPEAETDIHVVMPNHFHGIVWINNVGAGSPRPILPDNQTQGGETPPLRKMTLGQMIGYFKYQTTKQINILRDNPGVPVWQRNYYERIIRDDGELRRLRDYVAGNSGRWGEGEGCPENMENPGQTRGSAPTVNDAWSD